MPSEITFGKTISSTSPYIENELEVKPIATIPTDIAFQADLNSKGVADARGGTLSQISETAVLPVGNKGFTGNVYIDGILFGGNYWTSGSSSSTTTTIDYSFRNSETASFDDDIAEKPYDWFAGEKASMVNALNSWSAVANIQFVNAGDNNESATFGFYKVDEVLKNDNILGLFNPPGTDKQGIGYFNWKEGGWNTDGIAQGASNFIPLIHELGHGLGLAHPHDNGGGSSIYPGVTDFAHTGDYGLNQGVYTTMSSNEGLASSGGDPGTQDYGYQDTPMAFDIAAIQYLYGANNSYKTGNDTYFLPTANQSGTYYSCIWDAGGIDTISGVGALSGVTINLNDASLNPAVDGAGAGGYISSAEGIFGGFTIANGAIIENADGSAFADLITGNEFNNTLNGGAGNDSLIGGSGNDTLNGEAGNDSLSGGNGNDSLDAGLGADTMNGGDGNDTYIVDNVGDVVAESFNNVLGGVDTVLSSVSYSLAPGTVSGQQGYGIENLTLTGSANINGTGNHNKNTITGNSGNNTINGGVGNDTLNGGDGNDTLNGGDGKDILTGGSGSDRFTYTALSQSLLANYDVITDYSIGDQIDAPSYIVAATLTTSVGNAASLSAAAISTVLTSGVFTANSAEAFRVSDLAGTFIAFNDAVAGFNSANDSLIFLKNYTLGSVSIV